MLANTPEENLLLSTIIRVRQSGIRSVNVERDLQNEAVVLEYLLTAQSRASLDRIASHLQAASPARAWTLTGPYGSGKSYFALFLMNLICKTSPGHQIAHEQLAQADPLLSKKIDEAFKVSSGNGFLAVPISGFRGSFQDCLRIGFLNALEPYCEQKSIANLVRDLNSWTSATESRHILAWLQNLADTLRSLSDPLEGVLIILDEMGKPLEFAGLNPDQTDVYLLQELAEFANRGFEFPFVFLGILHQAFERYASFLNGPTQREWSKVQGRFEDIAFQEPPVQQMRLLARGLEMLEPERLGGQMNFFDEIISQAEQDGWRPALMGQEEYLSLCKQAFPFHPASLTALPILFKRLAQNERSLFAFLASHEPYGFQDFLQTHSFPDLLRLPHLFDYLVANYQARLSSFGRARYLVETLERLNNAPNLSPLETDIVKTIGLINWLSEAGAITASEKLIYSALSSQTVSGEDIWHALRRLQDRSLIVFRRFNLSFSIWQGSDVDLEAGLEQARQKLSGAFSLAEAVQQFLPPRPLAARRHSYQTGTMRHFQVRYVDISTYAQLNTIPVVGASGLAILALPASSTEAAQFEAWATSELFHQRPDLIIGVAARSARLAELVHELRCLRWVRENTPELSNDPVARRELRARFSSIETLIGTELDANLSLYRQGQAESCRWFWQGKPVSVAGQNGLSQLLSTVCDQLYPNTPRLWNELINRRALSSQAAAARRNLIEAMLTRSNHPGLGIQGFPPERSMYESILKAGGLHSGFDDKWEIDNPPPNDPLRLEPVWSAISEFIFSPPSGPRPLPDLYHKLTAAPYGLTDGVLPVLLCAFLLAHQQETSLYREGTLLPEPGVADWEVLLRRPELFAVSGCRVTGPLFKIVNRLARGLRCEPAVMPIVRTLVRRLKALPEHAWRTQRLAPEALAVRRLVETAHSPEQLLFHDLPAALGLLPLDETLPDETVVSLFFDRLNAALDGLAAATPNLIAWARDVFLDASGLPLGETGWDQLRALSLELAPRVNDNNLLPLLKRASEGEHPTAALESTLAFIANKPVRGWSDSDADRFFTQAKQLGEIIKEQRNGFLPASLLTKEQQARCRSFAVHLKEVLSTEMGTDPFVLRAAMQVLAHELAALGTEPVSESEKCQE